MQAGLADQVQVLLGGDAAHTIGVRLLETGESIERDGGLLLAGLALAGGHEDNAIRRTGTVDGRGGGILEDIDGLDIGGVQVVQVAAGHTVDDDERSGGTGGSETADGDVVTGTRNTARLNDIHARHGAVKGTQRIGGVLLLDFVTGNVDRGTGQEFLLLGTITDDDGLIQEFRVFLERDVDDGTSAYGNGLGRIPDAGEREGCVGRNGDGITSVRFRKCSDSPVTVQHDSSTDHRLAARVCHFSLHGDVLGEGARRRNNHHHCQEKAANSVECFHKIKDY